MAVGSKRLMSKRAQPVYARSLLLSCPRMFTCVNVNQNSLFFYFVYSFNILSATHWSRFHLLYMINKKIVDQLNLGCKNSLCYVILVRASAKIEVIIVSLMAHHSCSVTMVFGRRIRRPGVLSLPWMGC